MPDTEQCPKGLANDARITDLKESLEDFRTEVRADILHINNCIDKLTNHYSARPTWFVSLVITALVGIVVFLAQYIITNL